MQHDHFWRDTLSMRRFLRIVTGVLVAVAAAAAAIGLWLLSASGYESEAPHFVGSLFLAGAAVAVLGAVALRYVARRS